MKKTSLFTISIVAMLASNAAMAENLPTREEMWKMIQMQQKQIEALQAQAKQQNQRLVTTEAKAEKAAEKVEKTAEIAKQTEKQIAELEPAAGGGTSRLGWWDRTSIGGYGELHYNGGMNEEIDLHRFVVNLNHDFNDDIRFRSEVEIEHALAGDGQPGEVEIEQAYVEFDLTEDDAHRAKAGVFLVPVGMLNETHEPATFYGVERNPVEKNIIPTTWWEAGAALSGRLGESGFSYDVAAHSGLRAPTTGTNAYKVRNGRQKVAEAEASDPAFTGRVKWTGYPGVELGVTGQYQRDFTQNANDNENVGATLVEAHANLRRGGAGLRALYARWDLDSAAAEALGRDEQYGWFVEPSYRFDTPVGDLGVFARYNMYDNNAGISNSTTEFKQTDIGVNYWPHENVVLKADFAFVEGPTNAQDDEILNLGVGWNF